MQQTYCKESVARGASRIQYTVSPLAMRDTHDQLLRSGLSMHRNVLPPFMPVTSRQLRPTAARLKAILGLRSVIDVLLPRIALSRRLAWLPTKDRILPIQGTPRIFPLGICLRKASLNQMFFQANGCRSDGNCRYFRTVLY